LELSRSHDQLTPEQADKAKLKRNIVAETKETGSTEMRAEALNAGALNRTDVRALVKRSASTPLQNALLHLTAKDAMEVWPVATPEERAVILPSLRRKIRESKTLTPQEKRAFNAILP
jgi:hypothetical protein